MLKSQEQSSSPEGDSTFLTRLGEIQRQVGLLDATRSEVDNGAKMGALSVIKELETTTDKTDRKRLIFELSTQVGLFDGTRSNIDRDAKLEVLKLLNELE
jgi:hypothetical protein